MFNSGILNGHLLNNVKLTINPVQKDIGNNPLFSEEYYSEPSRKWEVRYDNGYPNVMYDPKYGKFRCYYTVFTHDEDSSKTPLNMRTSKLYSPSESRITSLCYAESEDGVNWYKPNLGLVKFEGDTRNNIIMQYAHGTGVFLDEEEIDPRKRYKLVTKVFYSKKNHYMAVSFSEDGIHFEKLREWPKYNPRGDTHNFPFRDKKTQKFKLITRIWKDGVRIAAISESDDFINWSEPKEILRGDGFQDQVYSMPVFLYDNIYIGLASIYHEGDHSAKNFDLVDVELKYSTNLEHWDRVGGRGEYYILRGVGNYPDGEFDCGCIYASSPIEIDNKMFFYYMGSNGPHTGYRETSFARSWIEKDKFAYYETKDKSKVGFLYTKPFTLYGDELLILMEKGGSENPKISLCREDNTPYSGYESENCILTETGTPYKKINFKDKKIKDLKGNSIVISLEFSNAKIYAIAGDLESNKKDCES